jgi:hypothetical protein
MSKYVVHCYLYSFQSGECQRHKLLMQCHIFWDVTFQFSSENTVVNNVLVACPLVRKGGRCLLFHISKELEGMCNSRSFFVHNH